MSSSGGRAQAQALQGQAALLQLLADAGVAAAAAGELEHADGLRVALGELLPGYDGHIAHHAIALIERREFGRAAQVLAAAPADGAHAELVQCARGILALLQGGREWRPIFERLLVGAADEQVRRTAALWLDLARQHAAADGA